jgi:NADH-quinone oxidoreductase subunit I
MVKALSDTYSTFKTIFTGMAITMRHLFKKSVTLQYPLQRDVLPERVRLKLHVNIDDCIGCRLCERACPVECIDIGTIKSTDEDDLGETSTGHKKRLWLDKFDIDMAKCCYCELCVHPCPTDCITMVEEYEYSTYDRNDLIFSFADMTPEQIEEANRKLEEEEEAKRRKKEEAMLARKKKEEASAAAEAKGGGKDQEAGPESASAGSGDAAGAGASGDADSDAAREARRAEREARRAARKAEREAKKKSEG